MFYHALGISMVFMVMVAWDYIFQEPYQENDIYIEVSEKYFYDDSQRKP